MCKQNPLKQFRTMEGAERRAACRAHLAASHGIVFAANDPHALTAAQQSACADMAKSVCWRKSPSSVLSVGMAFYVYLARDAKPASVQAASVTARRPAFAYGRGHA